jgi:RNA polymerase sigma factor (sigma-70 family)
LDDHTRDLTAAIASGNAEALARFYRTWFPIMFQHARQATRRDESFCLDVVQDAMMKFIRATPIVNDAATLDGLLRTIVRRCAYDRLRAEARRARREIHASSHAHQLDSDHALVDQIAWLKLQLSSLNQRDSVLLDLRYRLGWTLRQIGAALGMKTGAVDGRINRTLASLRQAAGDDFND